ncbi:HTTM domain-containing protein [Aureliella helgolandensis]|uniref:Sporulation-delaying protein SdpB n=1 Tax=Aureliella helgolandensis TaxID=2527968 RepID=A0A518GH43_9BACT|nr:HTTM domain-containing protein [Aureliella helgolandensis]QDV27912.1 Sporulation-delaying protein SdpB [Aureliella helgolandensis]
MKDGQLDSPIVWGKSLLEGWDRFWFTPQLPHTLAIIRILCGGMLAYVHVIWTSLLTDFMGEAAWIDAAAIQQLHAQDWSWSWLFYVDQPWVLMSHELVAILASLLMMLGCATRVTIPLAWWMTLMVCHRMTGALFGLDQIVMLLAMYLMVARSGSVWSVDAVWRDRRGESYWLPSARASVGNNVATRLIQLHLCVIYLFGGLSKMRGEMWFDGSALWFSAVNFEYQSLDITWLGYMPFLIATLTSLTLFWETFYCALVWPRATRPFALGMAVLVHAGIGLALGMVTFGVIMLTANLAFVPPEMVRRYCPKIFTSHAARGEAIEV